MQGPNSGVVFAPLCDSCISFPADLRLDYGVSNFGIPKDQICPRSPKRPKTEVCQSLHTSAATSEQNDNEKEQV